MEGIRKILVLLLAAFMVSAVTIGNTSIYAEGSDNPSSQEERTKEEPNKTSEDKTEIANTKKDIGEKEEETIVNQIDEMPPSEAKQANPTAFNDVMPASTTTWGSWTITASPSDMWSVDSANGILVIEKAGSITIDGGGSTVQESILISRGVKDILNLTINNLNIKSSKVPIDIQSEHLVIMNIMGSNSIETTTNNNAAVCVSQDTVLQIEGSGFLEAIAIDGAGIGGMAGTSSSLTKNGPIGINSGEILSTSTNGAGIGSGKNGRSEDIYITGGQIQGQSSTGAGIGSGQQDEYRAGDSSVTHIMIDGGVVTGSSEGTGSGAGIGSGQYGFVDAITINGGTVIGRSRGGAGIGSGIATMDGGTLVREITINGGHVIAAVNTGAGIGGGQRSSVEKITITGGLIEAMSMSASDIGIGYNASAMQNLWINGGSVFAQNNKIPVQPRNNEIDRSPVYLGTLINQEAGKTKKIMVDGVDYKITDDPSLTTDSFYLYMTPKDHIISVTDINDNVSFYEAIWDSSRQRFTVSNDRIAGDFIVDGGTKGIEWVYEISGNILNITSPGDYSVFSCVEKTAETITVRADVSLTINDLVIDSTKTPCIQIYDNKNLKLKLAGENTLDASKSPYGAPSIFVAPTASLEISGTGTAICTAKGGAGIGGGDGQINGRITINSGTIHASSDNGAGIGGGVNTVGENITINNGSVTAESVSGAGIGGGEGGYGRAISINDGSIFAQSISGAGIGGGKNGFGVTIDIYNGTIIAKSTTGAGIGGGENKNGDDCRFIGGNVSAESTDGAGIGGGKASYATHMALIGGTITAKSLNGDGVGNGVSSAVASTSLRVDVGSIWATGKKDFSIAPTEDYDKETAVYEIKNQSPTSEIRIDSKLLEISGAHPGSNSFYAYLTKEEHEISTMDDTYTIKWYGTESDGMFKLKPPTPSAVSTVSTANSITITPPSSGTDIYGNAQYSIDGTSWQTETVFYNLKADKDYTVYVRYAGQGDYGESDPITKSVRTNPAEYTITIPKAITAGGAVQNVTVNTGAAFALGYGGQINVKVGSGMTNAGVMTLSRSAANITAQFKVNNSNFTDISKNVATFRTTADAPVSISVTQPTHTSGEIPAGSYKGKIVFTVEYTQ